MDEKFKTAIREKRTHGDLLPEDRVKKTNNKKIIKSLIGKEKKRRVDRKRVELIEK